MLLWPKCLVGLLWIALAEHWEPLCWGGQASASQLVAARVCGEGCSFTSQWTRRPTVWQEQGTDSNPGSLLRPARQTSSRFHSPPQTTALEDQPLKAGADRDHFRFKPWQPQTLVYLFLLASPCGQGPEVMNDRIQRSAGGVLSGSRKIGILASTCQETLWLSWRVRATWAFRTSEGKLPEVTGFLFPKDAEEKQQAGRHRGMYPGRTNMGKRTQGPIKYPSQHLFKDFQPWASPLLSVYSCCAPFLWVFCLFLSFSSVFMPRNKFTIPQTTAGIPITDRLHYP